MKHLDSRRLLPLAAAVAAVFSIAACGDRTSRPADSPTTTGTAPTTTSSPNTAAAPTTGTASGTTGTSTTTASPGVLAASDREFFALAASSDALEVESGKLALDKSKDASLRKFAQNMIDGHSETSQQLMLVAGTVGASPPTAMAPPHSAQLDKLRSLSGTEFDREYAAQIGVAAHQEAVALFERAQREASNADVRAFAEKTLPDLRQHLQDGQALAKNIGVPADRLKMANSPPDLSNLSAMIPSGPNNTTSTTGSGSTSGTDVSKSGTTATSPADTSDGTKK